MSLTPSTMLELGSALPAFQLNATGSDKKYCNETLNGQAVAIAFICNHCPYVLHIAQTLTKAFNQLQTQGIATLAISSNDISTHPADAPEKMTKFAKEHAFKFPYLYDESQDFARALDAACTPDFYLFDTNHKLVYRGRFDGSSPGNDIEVTGEDFSKATAALLNQHAINPVQKHSIGCNIKWKT